MQIEERAASACYRACHLAAVSQSTFTPADSKAVAAYLVVTHCNVPGATLARAIGVTKQNIWKLIRRVEDTRDEDAFDKVVGAMEDAMNEAI